MNLKDLKIKEINPKEFTDKQWDQYLSVYESYNKEINPRDPFWARDQIKKFIIKPHKLWDHFRWVATEDKNIIAYCWLSTLNKKSPEYEKFKHIGDFDIIIPKELRRRGIGTNLLNQLIKKSKELGLNKLQGESCLESGKGFIKKNKWHVGSNHIVSRLYLDDLDWDMVRDWIKEGPDRGKGVSIETFEKIPEKDIIEYSKIYTETENQAPDYDSGDITSMWGTSPEDRRAKEELYSEKNYKWITKMTRESNSKFSGITEIYFSPENPWIAEQDLTGVQTEYRGRGLGKWLKADMLIYIKENFPDVKFVETGNANSNAPMLSINHRLGFKEHQVYLLFSFEI